MKKRALKDGDRVEMIGSTSDYFLGGGGEEIPDGSEGTVVMKGMYDGYNDPSKRLVTVDWDDYGKSGVAVEDIEKIGKRAESIESVLNMEAVVPKEWEGSVRKMKEKEDIDNPFALANYMESKDYDPHYTPEGKKKNNKKAQEENKFLNEKEATMKKKAISRDDFSYTYSDNGYTITYKGEFLTGAGTDKPNTMRGRGKEKQREQYVEMANATIDQILRSYPDGMGSIVTERMSEIDRETEVEGDLDVMEEIGEDDLEQALSE